MTTLDRWKLLAAETFSYSYDNYADHRGNARFDRYMPQDVRILDHAVRESWTIDRLAKELERSEEDARKLLNAFSEALDVVDAPSPAESFRRSVRQVVKRAAHEGLETDDQIEALVVQICYRVADLSFLLRSGNQPLHTYSEALRREPGVEYSDGGA
ncbi:MAG TPA: hypothetical protein VMS98_10665 [Thermoanaerobaculia bacterium]|nr:hypothetical protein [Thermoanaerobaculia bacterium]